MTVMFADIRNFTELAEFMNTDLQSISPEIRRHRGFVVNFVGDSTMDEQIALTPIKQPCPLPSLG